MTEIITIDIKTEWDIITARQFARKIAKSIGFDVVDQARIATAIGELAKNIFLYAEIGQIEIEKIDNEDLNLKGICIIAKDSGPGIADIKSVLGENSPEGIGAGIPGVKRLMDNMDITSEVGRGTKIRVEKWLRMG
ncbi:serine/threonine protein kinase [Ureibacillus massiliensis 4400831 = CIP 108448 = CCUG 49529]|uniref:Serine/threonine protein kinase n=1 Tax=Ureibacillus massiliensis 4400831 = CIP 108448 = CCUG 49529 TaxID=1211035 RepID=A0A0A3JXY1_9BACL|nr:anti-sigma regulatory factor [Ureibacillus massiliensis]KGR91837.1 serine/threonine protein kinase [Ureibacillus massiliensis 4400831 = CIP 108448 = CCUG 49529]BDH63402.1 serine/threonine-protein kinase RsbT [Lysinibacillus sp. PLM2]